MKTVFNQYWEKYDDWYDKNKFAYLSELEAVKKVLPKKGEGLEIGVGTGRFADPLNIKTGIDPSENMIRLAKKRGVNAKLGSGEQLLFKNSTFDYVAIIITLCFVQNPQKVLKESGRVLKQKGKVQVKIQIKMPKDIPSGEYLIYADQYLGKAHLGRVNYMLRVHKAKQKKKNP